MLQEIAANLKSAFFFCRVSDQTYIAPAGMINGFASDPFNPKAHVETSEEKSFYHSASLNPSLVTFHSTSPPVCDGGEGFPAPVPFATLNDMQ